MTTTTTAQTSAAAFSYNVSEGVSLLQAYIFNTTSNSSQPANVSQANDAQGLELTTNVVGPAAAAGEKNESILGPPFSLTVYSQEHLIGTSVVLGIMILCCIIGNCFVIAAVVLERSLHNVANYLILSLAVADLMVAVLVMPLSVVAEISRVWFLHPEVCDMWISFDVLCCTASILHLVAIAMDRYWAVTSIDYMRRRSARRILLMILAVWVVALTISIPPLFGWRDPNNTPDETGVCIISQDHGYTIFSTVGAFYLPMFIMICIYIRIYMVARRRIRKEKFNKKKKREAAAAAAAARGGGTALRDKAAENINMTVQPEYSVVSNCNGCTLDKDKDGHGHGHSHGHTSKNGTTNTTTTNTPTTTAVTTTTATTTTPTTHNKEEKHENSQGDLSGDNDSQGGLPAGNGKDGGGGYTNGIETDPPTMIHDKGMAGTPDGTRKPCLPSSRQREKLEQKRERKAARTLAIITGAFLLCWLPFFVVALTGPFIRSQVVIPPVVHSLLLWLGYLNSLLNPVIYTIFSPEFRNAFQKILFGKYSRRSRMRGR